MNEARDLAALLLEKAMTKRRRVGIGILSPTEPIVAGLKRAEAYCTPVVYGAEVPRVESVAAPDPVEALFDDLESGRIDAAVRGQIHALPFRERYARPHDSSFRPGDAMITVLSFPDGRPLVVSPATNLTAGTYEEKEGLLLASIRFCRLLGIPPRAGLLARCRREDLVDLIGTPLAAMFEETDRLVARFDGIADVRNYGIDFEKAYEDGVTILVEPDGTTGNQVIRTLCFLGTARFFGCPYMTGNRVVVETFRNARDFPDVLLLAAALAGESPRGRGEEIA